MRKIMALVLLVLVGGAVSGCVVEAPGGWHHHRHYY